jgi:hypothetical protein
MEKVYRTVITLQIKAHSYADAVALTSQVVNHLHSLPASAFIAKQEVDFEHDNDGQRVLYLPAIPKKDGE